MYGVTEATGAAVRPTPFGEEEAFAGLAGIFEGFLGF
jgi:hypothetical protein